MQLVKQNVPQVQLKTVCNGADNVATVSSIPVNVTAEVSVMNEGDYISLFQIHHTYSAVQNAEVLYLQSH
jgi:hypothetical protein